MKTKLSLKAPIKFSKVHRSRKSEPRARRSHQSSKNGAQRGVDESGRRPTAPRGAHRSSRTPSAPRPGTPGCAAWFPVNHAPSLQIVNFSSLRPPAAATARGPRPRDPLEHLDHLSPLPYSPISILLKLTYRPPGPRTPASFSFELTANGLLPLQ